MVFLNHELSVLGNIIKATFDFLDDEINLFGVYVSPLDIVITNIVIIMLLDIVLTYAGYDRTE